MSDRITTFRDFWPYYVGEHRRAGCRRLHFLGTTCALVSLAALCATCSWYFVPLGLVTSYGPAWVGHFFVEKNRPATFRYPLFSLAADFVMYGKMWAGRMDAEVAKLGLAQ